MPADIAEAALGGGVGVIVISQILFLITYLVETFTTFINLIEITGNLGLASSLGLLVKIALIPVTSFIWLISSLILGKKMQINVKGEVIENITGEGIEGARVIFYQQKDGLHTTLSNWVGKFRTYLEAGEYGALSTKVGYIPIRHREWITTGNGAVSLTLKMAKSQGQNLLSTLATGLCQFTNSIYRTLYPVVVAVVLVLATYMVIINPTMASKVFLGLMSTYTLFSLAANFLERYVEAKQDAE